MGRKWSSKMKTMKKMMTLLAVAGLVLALAPAAQAATITYTDDVENAGDYTTSGNMFDQTQASPWNVDSNVD